MSAFEQEVAERLGRVDGNENLKSRASAFLQASIDAQYSYNFFWQGRPVIQYPQDIMAVQELVWRTRPDLIIETGIAHGGSLILNAGLLALLDYADAAQSGSVLDPGQPNRRVLGIDIDIREHNRTAIEAHPMAGRIDMIQGSSVDREVIEAVRRHAQGYERIMLCLDSNHTHDHVLSELNAYADLVTPGCYCVVFDTVIETMTEANYTNRPWRRGDNAMTAVQTFLESNSQFRIDRDMDRKLLVSVAPEGYLLRC